MTLLPNTRVGVGQVSDLTWRNQVSPGRRGGDWSLIFGKCELGGWKPPLLVAGAAACRAPSVGSETRPTGDSRGN
jgi:hypothetical protein